MNSTISPEFKKQARNAILGIAFFIFFYLILIAFSIALTIGCFYAGIQVMKLKLHFFTLIFGFGIASVGVLILIFLFKFLFKKNTSDLSIYTEITRNQEPQLFAMIDEIVLKVGTDFPKKVYLSDQVNASVFYDSSFWSMFLPIRKNLHIGMGLINSVTVEELKAIVSHEFGHFSQKTMKVGSYVYNVNHIIYNLLYDNSSYSSLAAKWTNVSSYFVIFVGVAFKIIEGIQWLLQKMYNLVNKNYLALSREMEFHADEVAAGVTGYLPLTTSLLRFDLSTSSFENVIQFYNKKVDDSIISSNIFKELNFVMHFHAQRQKLPIKNNFPEVTLSDVNSFQKSKLVIKNQWASHPETEERIAALEKTKLIKEHPNNEPARTLFSSPDALEEQLTAKLFIDVPYSKPPQKISLEDFSQQFLLHYEKETFDLSFKGYYDMHSPTQFMNFGETPEIHSFEELFSDEKVAMVKELSVDQNDLAILQAIQNKSISVSTFDYEGTKYKAKETEAVMEIVNNSIAKNKTLVQTHDRAVYLYFCKKAEEKGMLHDYKSISKKFVEYDALFDSNFELNNLVISDIEFMHEQNQHDVINSKINQFRPNEEKFKEALKTVLLYTELESEITAETRENAEHFINKNLVYFAHEEYIQKDTSTLFEMINLFQYLNQRLYFKIKKRWLDKMLQVEGKK